ncbi:TolB-like protein [Rhizobium sp. BK529]|nr:TolB-like protein [Rhizobium sp. BK529]
MPKGGYVPHFEYARGAPAPLDPVEILDRAHDAEYEAQDHSLPKTHRPGLVTLLGLGAALAVVLALFILALTHALSWRDASTAVVTPTRPGPKVFIEFFTESSSADAGLDIARGLRDDIIGRLAQFDDIVVVADPLRGEHGASADYALQGNVQLDGSRLRAAARLVRQSDGVVIWADNFDADLQTQNELAIQGNVARLIADAIAQPYGVIFQTHTDKPARPAQTGDQTAYICMPAYTSYRQTMTAQSHSAVRECLQQATQRFPDDAVSWALLSTVYLDEIRFRHALGMSSSTLPLALANTAAERAISLAPGNPNVLQAQMLVNFFSGDIDEALKVGTAAYAADPDNVELAGEYGFRLAMSGKWQSGCELLSVALNKGIGARGYYEIGMALCAFMKGDIEEAEQWSRRSDLDNNPMHRLVLLSILGAAGKMGEAMQQKDWLNIHAPVLMANIRQEVSLRLPRPEDQERFLNGLRAAGLVISAVSAR